jgi:uncharacterized membrane protein
MDLTTSKNLGGVGAILMVVAGPLLIFAAPYAGLLALIGFILALIALKGLGDYYNESAIFNNALYGFIVGIVGGVVSVAVVFFTVLTSLTDFLYTLYPDWNGDWTALSGLTPDPSNLSLDNLMPLLGGLFAALIILFVFVILTAWLYRKSLNSVSVKSGVGMFGTAGLLLLIGAVLTIIIVGFLLIWIALILLAVAFFSIRTTAGPTPEAPAPPPPS